MSPQVVGATRIIHLHDVKRSPLGSLTSDLEAEVRRLKSRGEAAAWCRRYHASRPAPNRYDL